VDADHVCFVLASLEMTREAFRTDINFNFDERSWKCGMVPNKVLSEEGTEAVKLKKYREEEESYTPSWCISASGEKFLDWFLAKGKAAGPITNLATTPMSRPSILRAGGRPVT
jgi:hypothetical protein